jgi:hypothetical protein
VGGKNETIGGFSLKVSDVPGEGSRHLGKNVSELV